MKYFQPACIKYHTCLPFQRPKQSAEHLSLSEQISSAEMTTWHSLVLSTISPSPPPPPPPPSSHQEAMTAASIEEEEKDGKGALTTTQAMAWLASTACLRASSGEVLWTASALLFSCFIFSSPSVSTRILLLGGWDWGSEGADTLQSAVLAGTINTILAWEQTGSCWPSEEAVRESERDKPFIVLCVGE